MENDFSATSITSGLDTRFIGQRIVYRRRVTSTMDVARAEARQGAAEGTLVIADEQATGRGRLKRAWLSPEGSLAMSLLLYPQFSHLSSLIMLASLAVAHSIGNITGLKPQLKWPNDVLLNGKKVCGILIESQIRGDTVGYAIIGLGLNINMKMTDFPEIAPTATSLSDELGREVSFLGMLKELLREMERLYLTLTGGGSLYEEWRDNLVTLGREVNVTAGENNYQGTAESVAEDGSLLLRQPGGHLIRVVAGDATLRKDS